MNFFNDKKSLKDHDLISYHNKQSAFCFESEIFVQQTDDYNSVDERKDENTIYRSSGDDCEVVYDNLSDLTCMLMDFVDPYEISECRLDKNSPPEYPNQIIADNDKFISEYFENDNKPDMFLSVESDSSVDEKWITFLENSKKIFSKIDITSVSIFKKIHTFSVVELKDFIIWYKRIDSKMKEQIVFSNRALKSGVRLPKINFNLFLKNISPELKQFESSEQNIFHLLNVLCGLSGSGKKVDNLEIIKNSVHEFKTNISKISTKELSKTLYGDDGLSYLLTAKEFFEKFDFLNLMENTKVLSTFMSNCSVISNHAKKFIPVLEKMKKVNPYYRSVLQSMIIKYQITCNIYLSTMVYLLSQFSKMIKISHKYGSDVIKISAIK